MQFYIYYSKNLLQIWEINRKKERRKGETKERGGRGGRRKERIKIKARKEGRETRGEEKGGGGREEMGRVLKERKGNFSSFVGGEGGEGRKGRERGKREGGGREGVGEGEEISFVAGGGEGSRGGVWAWGRG